MVAIFFCTNCYKPSFLIRLKEQKIVLIQFGRIMNRIGKIVINARHTLAEVIQNTVRRYDIV